MKAKQYFREIERLEKEIEVKKQRAELFREIASSPASIKYSDLPRAPQRSSMTPMADAINKAIDLEEEIKKDEQLLIQKKTIGLDALGKIDNTTYQKILIKRYLKK